MCYSIWTTGEGKYFQKVLQYTELAGYLQEKLPRAPKKYTSQITKYYYAKTSCNVSNDFDFSNVSEEDVKIFYLP